jgi:Short C-terminal domain
MGMFDKMAKKMMESAVEAAGALSGMAGGAQEITDGIEGIGTVAEVPVIDEYSMTYIQPIAMVIELPGHTPYAAQPMTAFPREKIPHKGQRLPVKVSQSDPMKIAVLWDRVLTGTEAGLEAAKEAAAAQAGAPAPTGGGGGDLIGELERLGTLRASGAITDEEFTALKARLLTS